MDSEEHRLSFILDGQQHCDHFLTPIADPAGKSVLVAGSGAGTEMLWCLRHGAREVVGIDVAPQTASALRAACAQMNLEPSFSMHQIAIEDATTLGRRFDLVLSNNVFEHVGDLPRSLRACAALVENAGRIAIFTDPLYYSSSGSHLPHEPWEHLWGEAEQLRAKILRSIPDHPLAETSLDDYLFGQISLNRMRLTEFIEAVRASGLALLNLRVVPDRNLASLGEYRARLEHLPIADLTIEGIAAELVRIENTNLRSTEELLLADERMRHQEHIALLADERMRHQEHIALLETSLQHQRELHEIEKARLADTVGHWTGVATDVKKVLDGVEKSLSFRIGRAITAPLRWIGRRRAS